MDIVRKARQLEEGIARALDGAARKSMRSGPAEPLEILHAICDAAAAEVQPAGRGKHVFPFNRIRALLLAPSREARARVAAVFDSEPSLKTRIIERLHAAGCGTLLLDLTVVYLSEAEGGWMNPQWHVEFSRTLPATPADLPTVSVQRRIELTILTGLGGAEPSSFGQDRIDLGRCAEVRDGRNRLLRTNHVAFADDGGHVNQSVSRRHAYIELTAASAEYRVHDDRSAHGTSVLRGGRMIQVPSAGRGIRLQSGDEIVLGEARVMVRILE